MTHMSGLLEVIERMPNCNILPCSGIPEVKEGHLLPADLKEFYGLCGGVHPFTNTANRVLIVPPAKLLPSNPVILLGMTEEDIAATKDDISWSWYILGEADNAQYITIDLSPERLGKCYDSFWELHPGNSPIISHTFSDLLSRLVASQGKGWYWDQMDFIPMGSPYPGRQL